METATTVVTARGFDPPLKPRTRFSKRMRGLFTAQHLLELGMVKGSLQRQSCSCTQQSAEVSIIAPILQMKKPRLREVKSYAT